MAETFVDRVCFAVFYTWSLTCVILVPESISTDQRTTVRFKLLPHVRDHNT